MSIARRLADLAEQVAGPAAEAVPVLTVRFVAATERGPQPTGLEIRVHLDGSGRQEWRGKRSEPVLTGSLPPTMPQDARSALNSAPDTPKRRKSRRGSSKQPQKPNPDEPPVEPGEWVWVARVGRGVPDGAGYWHDMTEGIPPSGGYVYHAEV